jgi:hypothetical protein
MPTMLVHFTRGGSECYDCCRGWSADEVSADPRLTPGQRCPVPQCNSNHQFACNEASESESHSPCLCTDAVGGISRAQKPALSTTGLTDDDRRQMQAATDLVNAIVDVNGTMTDTQALFRIRTMLNEFYAETPRLIEQSAAAVR